MGSMGGPGPSLSTQQHQQQSLDPPSTTVTVSSVFETLLILC